MNADLKGLWGRISAAVDEGAVLAKHAYAGIKTDIRELAELGESKLRGLIDKAVENDSIRQMAKAFFANAKKGKAVAVKALKREHAKYERTLDELVDDKPEIVGFWDGFVCIFLTTPADRRPGSRIYATHAKYGKVVGVASAVLLFLPVRGISAVLGALPVLVRGAQYLQKKVLDAKGKMKKSKQTAGRGKSAAKRKTLAAKPAKKKSPTAKPVKKRSNSR